MGPHGLLIGATGSGKSELLRTLVLALAATHTLGGAQLRPGRLQGRRHLRLAGPAAAHRRGDHQPRRRAAAGGPDGRRDLRRAEPPAGAAAPRPATTPACATTSGPGPAARRSRRCPSLLIVCDEFSELLTAKPDFIDLFVQIGRVGRSLGVHLLLASQRLEEGRLRGLDTHLSYRIGLRTFSALESRAVLGVPDAYELPRSPGHGYLQARHRAAAAVQGGVRLRARTGARGPAPDGRRDAARLLDLHQPTTCRCREPADAGRAAAPSESDRRACWTCWSSGWPGRGRRPTRSGCRRWTRPPTLDELLGPLATDPQRGPDRRQPGSCTARCRCRSALVDKPFEQRRDLLLAGPGRGGRARRGRRRPAERQVDAAADAGLRAWR